ncbi:hypothetical protein GCM10010302_05410 [Streptomyces polychromogenes]|uniref:Uncharacterized protein n=1 Tax=Streptomyces polychromogenes TaxID=67342 RepID=A0ABN0V1I6_9ACTN
MTQEIEKIGSVGLDRYTEIVTELRKLVETVSRAHFAIGDYALEVEPMRAFRMPEGPCEEEFTVRDSLFRLAEDIGLSYSVVKNARWAASK